MVKLRGNRTPKKEPVVADKAEVETTVKTKSPEKNTKRRSMRIQEGTAGKKTRKTMTVAPEESEAELENEQESDVEMTLEVSHENLPKDPETPNDEESVNEAEQNSNEDTEASTIISVSNLDKSVSRIHLNNHFRQCGKIVSCTLDYNNDGTKIGVIEFKSAKSAKCAVATQHGQIFHDLRINVTILETENTFTDNTVCLKKIPKGNSLELYNGVEKAMSKFGNILNIKFGSGLSSATVQFENNAAVTSALEAGRIELKNIDVLITAFSSPEKLVILYGLAEGTTKEEIQTTVSKHHPVVSVALIERKPGKLSRQALVELETEESVEHLLELQTLKVKTSTADVLPYSKSKRYFNVETRTYYRHPGGVFIENLPKGIGHVELRKQFKKFGTIHFVTNLPRFAIVIYESAIDAKKALECKNIRMDNRVLMVNAMDGCYQPAGTNLTPSTLIFSNITHHNLIPEMAAKLKLLNIYVPKIVGNYCPVTRHFEHSATATFDNTNVAKDLLDLEIYLDDKRIKIEQFDINKYRQAISENWVLVKNLHKDVKELDLWKGAQSFGAIKGVFMHKKSGYVRFSKSDFTEKALASSGITMKGKKYEFSRMNGGIICTLEKAVKKPDVESADNTAKHAHQISKVFNKTSSWSPHGVKNKPIFKKKTFKKPGVWVPRPGFVN